MSRTNFGAKPLMYPQPVLIIGTYDENGVPNAMNAAWGITTDFKEISISLSEHKTTDNLAKRGAFTVSMATEDQVVACDYVGIESGRKIPEDIREKTYPQDVPGTYPMANKDFHTMYVGEIVDAYIIK